MIVTRQRPLEELLKKVGPGPVLLVGCSECATLCGTGGEPELRALEQAFMDHGVPVAGSVVLDPACHLHKSTQLLKRIGTLGNETTVLVMACGNGLQTVSSLLPQLPVVAGTETLFVGEVVSPRQFEKRCVLCGSCLVDSFEGLCPIARCPKSMLNGPCGGARQGRCEVGSDTPCVWDLIDQRRRQKGCPTPRLRYSPPQDWSQTGKGRTQP